MNTGGGGHIKQVRQEIPSGKHFIFCFLMNFHAPISAFSASDYSENILSEGKHKDQATDDNPKHNGT